MRRDHFSLEIQDVDAPGRPAIHVAFDGPSERLVELLTDDAGASLDPEEVDVAYRLRDHESGVLGVTNRVTGEFILETNAATADVFEFIQAARECAEPDGERCYHLTVSVDDEPILAVDKGILLVYGPDGDLRRSDSLIPSGVEL